MGSAENCGSDSATRVSCHPCRVREGEGVHREKEVERIMMNGESMGFFVCLFVFLIHGALARKKSFFFCVFTLSHFSHV